MDRLAYIGCSGMGALLFRPTIDWQQKDLEKWIELSELGRQATQIFDGDVESVLAVLANAGGSGGASQKR